MYDKANCLRIELTINDPREFKVFRDVHHKDGTVTKNWVPMSKGISNLYRYIEIGKACNERYIRALVNIVPVKSTQSDIEKICSRTKDNKGHTFTGLNVWETKTYQALRLIKELEINNLRI